MTLPDLDTPRLLLRDVLLVDQVAYEKNFADYEVIRTLAAAVPWPYPKGGVATFLETLRPDQGKTRWAWAIYRKDTPDDPIGSIDLRRTRIAPESHPHQPENRGFWLARHHWGQGYMTEATDAVTDYAFNILNFETLTLSNALGNTRSRRIKEKAGAVLLRTEPAQFVDPTYTHREIWQLTRDAWATRNR
jgi:RimJ/RimL family protein N-acetyltransferase